MSVEIQKFIDIVEKSSRPMDIFAGGLQIREEATVVYEFK